MTTLVVDSSVCLKWVLDDEIDANHALQLQKQYLAGEINLIAPNLWQYEILSGLKNVVLNNPTIPNSLLETKLLQLLDSSPNLFEVSDLYSLILKYAFSYQISAYDSVYLTLAHANGFTLVTADKKLAAKIADPKLVIYLSEYYNASNN